MSTGIPLVDLWGLRGLWWPFEEFEDILRISWEPEVWGPWVPFVHFLDFLRTFWTLWGILEDLRTWFSQNVEESFRNFWWLLVKQLRTWCLWGLQWLFRTLRILRTWLPTEDFEDVDKFLRTLKSPWIRFVGLWGLRGLWYRFEKFEAILRISWEPEVWGPWVPFVHFLDFLRTLWTFWGLFIDLRTWCSQNIEEPFWNFWWLLVDHLRTVFRKFWGLFEDHLMSIWGTFDDHRILTTLITSWGLWCRLEYLLWTSEDFEGFDDLLRNLRTFWGSVENLRSEDLGYLLCIFLTFWGLSGPFEEFWKTWGTDFLRTLKNLSGTFDDFLWSYWGPDAFEDYNDFSGHWGFCEPDYLLRTMRTLINFWGLWNRLEYVLWTYEDFEGFDNLLRNLRPFWGSVENLRSEDLGYLLCIFLTFWGLCGPFEDFLKTWGPDALRTLKNLSGTFDDFLWTIWGLFLGNFEDFLRII